MHFIKLIKIKSEKIEERGYPHLKSGKYPRVLGDIFLSKRGVGTLTLNMTEVHDICRFWVPWTPPEGAAIVCSINNQIMEGNSIYYV